MNKDPTRVWKANDRPYDHAFGEYELKWFAEPKQLIFSGKGQDTPIDLWGFDHSFPPEILTDNDLNTIRKIFGQEVEHEIRGLPVPMNLNKNKI